MLADRAKPILEDPQHPQAPYVVVLLQECGRANVLLRQIRGTLEELAKGLNGQLSMSEAKREVHGILNASSKICFLVVNGQSFLVIDCTEYRPRKAGETLIFQKSVGRRCNLTEGRLRR